MLFEKLTLVSAGEVVINMSPFELVATVVVLLNVWLYGRLSIWGPILGVVGCVLWITMGAVSEATPMWGLIILNIILLSQNIWNYIKWSRNKKLAVAAEEQVHHQEEAKEAA